jgi:SelR domain
MRKARASTEATTTREVTKPDEQWHQELTPSQYRVLRKAHTEMPFTGAYVHNHQDGFYRCAGCGAKAVQLGRQVQLGHRLAELRPARSRRGGRVAAGQRPVHAAHRGRVPPLRRPPWPRLQRRPQADR